MHAFEPVIEQNDQFCLSRVVVQLREFSKFD